ncbi:hypothetical protein [Micromonospora sp. DT63]|uniref:hypothetical protein n=1 Tax=Micromonospora sp. DT63 TaxID=3393441 RepID=UPI003CF43BAE
MPARRNPRKTRTPAPTPLGIDPAAGHGTAPAPPVESAGSTGADLPARPEAPARAVKSALPAPAVEPVLPALAAPAVPPVADSSVTGRPEAPQAGPPQAGRARSFDGKSQRAGQPRRYAYRRS